jgi:hypothetical protein
LGLTFFTLPTNYGVVLHQKIFQMVYFANGGFNWHDVYFMPVRLREFYYRELLKAKEEETSQLEKVSKSNSSSKTKRK